MAEVIIRAMDTPVKRIKRHYTPETWAEVRAQAVRGVPFITLSKLYGINPQVISNRSRAEEWPTPTRLKQRREEFARDQETASEESKHPLASYPEQDTKDSPNPDNPEQLTKDSALERFTLALSSLVDSPPADFQTAFATVAQAAIAAGIREVPTPRNVKELATWFDLWRKAAGLDKVDKASGPAPLIDPMRRVSRRASSAVVDVPADPVAGSPEWEAWEV